MSKDKPLTHAQRMTIISRPFPEVIRHQVSYPWAGTIVNDDMATLMLEKKRVRTGTGEREFDNTPDAIFSGWSHDNEVEVEL